MGDRCREKNERGEKERELARESESAGDHWRPALVDHAAGDRWRETGDRLARDWREKARSRREKRER
jgi:hypothetical protein